MSLVSLEEAKNQLRVSHTEEDMTIDRMLVDAEGIVLNYITDVGSPAWDESSVPPQVRAAILEVTANLFRHRGDDGTASGPLTPRVEMMLRAYRDLPIA